MPRCRDCGKVQATAEVRRLPRARWRCKDELACARRRAEAARQLELQLQAGPEAAA